MIERDQREAKAELASATEARKEALYWRNRYPEGSQDWRRYSAEVTAADRGIAEAGERAKALADELRGVANA